MFHTALLFERLLIPLYFISPFFDLTHNKYASDWARYKKGADSSNE